MSAIKAILISAAALFAVVPGVATLRQGLLAPPGYEPIFSGITVAFGSLTILLCLLCRDRIAAKRTVWLCLTSVCLATIGLAWLACYVVVRSNTIIAVPYQSDQDPTIVETRYVFLPLWPKAGGTIQRELKALACNRRELAITRFNSIPRWVGEESMSVTVLLLLATELATCTLITAAFAVVGIGATGPHRDV